MYMFQRTRDRFTALTPRHRALAFMTAGALLVALVLVAVTRGAPGAVPQTGGSPATPSAATAAGSPAATAAGSPTADPSPVAIPSAPTVVALPPPAVPPEVAVIAKPVAPAATKTPATPTPSPDPNVWRVEGVLLDETTKLPLHQVCVVIGPHGCQRGSIRTDSRGVFFIDVPKNPTVLYDLYFVKDGYWTVWLRIRPEGPSVYNLALTPR